MRPLVGGILGGITGLVLSMAGVPLLVICLVCLMLGFVVGLA